MPTGIYKRTIQHGKSISNALKLHPPMKGKQHSLISRMKMSASMHGRRAWNKGKKGKQKNHNMEGLRLGRGWNKGKKMPKGFGEKVRLRMLGTKQSEATKRKRNISLQRINGSNWRGGVTLDKKYKYNINKKWNVKNREYRNFLGRKRNYLKKNASGSHTFEEWNNLKIIYRYMCLCCKRVEPEIKLTEDHIVPLFFSGTNFIWNIQPLCQSCNSKKYLKSTNYHIVLKKELERLKVLSEAEVLEKTAEKKQLRIL